MGILVIFWVLGVFWLFLGFRGILVIFWVFFGGGDFGNFWFRGYFGHFWVSRVSWSFFGFQVYFGHFLKILEYFGHFHFSGILEILIIG